MAWALQFDGINDSATLGSQVSFADTDNYTIIIKGKIDASVVSGSVTFLFGTSSGNSLYYNVGSGWVWRVGGSTINLTEPSSVGVDLVITLTKTSGNHNLDVNGASKNFPLNRSYNIVKIGEGFDRLNGCIESIIISGASSHDWDATASSHGAGTPILTDTIGGNDATGVNMPTDGSAWLDLGGGGVDVSELSSVSDSISAIDSVLLSGAFNISENTDNTLSISTVDGVSLASSVSVADSTNSTDSSSNIDSITLASLVAVLESSNNTEILSNSDLIALSGVFSISETVNNSDSSSVIDGVSLSSLVTINDRANNTNSISTIDAIFIPDGLAVLDSSSASLSLSVLDGVVLVGAVNIGGQENNSLSLSNIDSIQIGEFIFNVNQGTNIDGLNLSTNINGVYLSTNING